VSWDAGEFSVIGGCLRTSQSGIPDQAATKTTPSGMFIQNQVIVLLPVSASKC